MPVAISLAATVVGSSIAGSAVVIAAVGSIGASLLGGAVTALGAFAAASLTGSPAKPKRAEQQVQARIGGVSSAPPYRYVYGRSRIGGFRVFNHVEGATLYLGFLLNSRPSDGIEAVEFDTRELTWTSDGSNDIFDMAKGAAVTSDPFDGLARIWIGMGDQAGPPALFLSEIADSDILASSDIWEGVTVMWLRLDFGAPSTAADRWVNTPPEVRVTGTWSLLYDPREGTQDAADPDTWTYSDNAALAALDMARDSRGMNRVDDLVDFDSFAAGADDCDAAMDLSAGGTEARYRVGGVIEMGGQEAAKLEPLTDAAAARLIDVSGRLTYLAGVWRAPTLTLTDIVGEQMTYSDLREGRDAPNTIRTAIIAEDRAWQETEIAPLQDATALSDDGGVVREARLDLPLVPSPTQAMRLQKIHLNQLRLERSMTAEFPAIAYAAHGGDNITLALPAFDAADGSYEIQTLEPRLQERNGGVMLTIGLGLIETAESIFAWDETVDETTFASSEDLDNVPVPLLPGGALTVTSGARAVGDGSDVPQAILTFAPSASGAVVGYQVQRRISGGVWQDLVVVDSDQLDGAGDVYVETEGVSVGSSYDFRVYALSVDGRRSLPVSITGQTITAPAASVDAPIGGTATSTTPTEADVSFTTPADNDVRALRIYGSDTDDSGAAVEILAVSAAPNQTFTVTDTGLTSASTRYYFARSADAWGGLSAFTASVSTVIA
ncbi:MAG: phage tail protein [Minwuia sp.]|nr:phage tail protein [Minwuia sp.]